VPRTRTAYIPRIYRRIEMIVSIAKWGNSLAVRIPRDALRELRLSEGEDVRLAVEGDALVLRPVKRLPAYDLEDLVAGITEENRHEETATGMAAGAEY
jgi:antitoxin MazE